MKSIEEIGNISFEQLEAAADDPRIKVPSDLDKEILSAMTMASMQKQRSTRKTLAYTFSGILATALASLVIVLSLPGQPKDTFDDPMLAYAELEKTFSYISDKMERGIEIAAQATPVIEKTTEVFSK